MPLSPSPAPSRASRRDLLRQASLASLGVAAEPLAAIARPLAATRHPLPQARASRDRVQSGADEPVLPPIEIIALSRMGFGPRPGAFDAFQALGSTPAARLEAYVEQQLAPGGIDDADLDRRIAAAGFETLGKPLEALWKDHFLYEGDDYAVHIQPAWETLKATFLRAVYSRRQLFELLVGFWHDHFNVYAWDYWTSPVYVHYDRDVIRAHALGNFRTLLEAVATSPAMLYYLDNATNTRSGPNENYARELFELHTLGAENYFGVRRQHDVPGYAAGTPAGYVDDDVYEATRCFTGWRVDFGWGGEPGVGQSGRFLYYEPWHDRFQKRVLARELPSDQGPLQDGRDVLDMLAAHPGTGRHIARKLCRRLVADDPPADLVAEAARVFTANLTAPDQIAQVVRTIVRSEAFRATWGRKIKRPFEAVVGALRASEAEFFPDDGFIWFFNQTGHLPFAWPAPNGYPHLRQDWTSTMSLLQRWRVVGGILEGWVERTKVDVVGATPAALRTPAALADFWITRLLGRPMGGAGRDEVVTFMAQGRNPSYELTPEQIAERLPSLVGLILASPDFQWL